MLSDRQLRDDRRRAGFGEPIEAAFDPIEQPIGRHSVQQIVSDVGHERRRWQLSDDFVNLAKARREKFQKFFSPRPKNPAHTTFHDPSRP